MFKRKNKRFICKRTGTSTLQIYIDRETGIEYLSSAFGGFRPLYNQDGTLKVAKDFKEINK